jgi:hypothetical protein
VAFQEDPILEKAPKPPNPPKADRLPNLEPINLEPINLEPSVADSMHARIK